VCETILKLVFKYDVKLAHVVLAKAVLVPADDFEQEALLANYGQFDRFVPLGIQLLVYGGCGDFCIAEGEDEVLWTLWLETGVGTLIRLAWEHILGQKCRSGPLQRDLYPAFVLAGGGGATRGGHTLITLARRTKAGAGCSDISGRCLGLGLPLRLWGTEVGEELAPLEVLDCGCLRRCGSESLLVNVGRGMLAGCAFNRNLLAGPRKPSIA